VAIVAGLVPIVGLITACGGAAESKAGVPRPAKPSVAATVVTPSVAPSVAPTSASPQTVPPVVVIEQDANSQNVLQAMDPSGTPLWSVPYPGPGVPAVFTAGSRIFEVGPDTSVSVFDRTGHPAGSGVFTAHFGGMVFSPTSAEWAWSGEDGVSPSPAPAGSPVTVSGSFWVAGVGEAPHRVYRWTESDTAGAIGAAGDMLVDWSDQGLVSSMFAPWVGCAEGHQPTSYVVNPVSGRRTDLGSDPVLGVHAGVIASAPRNATPQAAQEVVLSGRTSFTWSEPLPGTENPSGVFISPDGGHVAIALFNIGCAGDQPRFRTAVISVSDHSVQYLPDAFAQGWLDDTQLVAQVTFNGSPNQELDIVGLDGTRSLLGHGRLIGVLTPA